MSAAVAFRWHSRAGQGAITVANALAQILGESGKFVQSFPDFGAEKRGAPVVVFNRIADTKITTVAHPTELDVVILLDPTLVGGDEVTLDELLAGLEKDGKLLINTAQKKVTSMGKHAVYAVDASTIAIAEIGKNIPNVPILGALLKITQLADLEKFLPQLEKFLSQNLPAPIVTGNLKACRRGFEEVKQL